MTILSVTMRTASRSTAGTLAAQASWPARCGIGGERRHHGGDEAGAAGAERTRRRQEDGRVLRAGTEQHVVFSRYGRQSGRAS